MCLIFAGNALAQTDININNTNLIRFGGSVSVPENQTVENASAFGGSVTVLPNARVLDTAIAFGGDIVLKVGARVDGDAYSFGGKIIQEPGAIIGGEKATFSDRHGMVYGSYGRQAKSNSTKNGITLQRLGWFFDSERFESEGEFFRCTLA